MLWLLIFRPVLLDEKLQVRIAVDHLCRLLDGLRTAEESRTGNLKNFRKLGHDLLDNRDLGHVIALHSLQVVQVRV